MQDDEELSEVIGDIYDAALDQALWPDVLGSIASYVGGPSAALFSKNASNAGNIYYDDGGLDPRFKRLYFEKYVKFDPSNHAHVFAEVEVPISTVDFIAYDEFLESRFYREWGRPQGLVDFISAVLDRSAASATCLGVFRHERDGIVDGETRRRMRRIVPHVRRAVLIGRAIDLKTAEAATLADSLDGLSAGVFLVSAAGLIVHANEAGRAMLDDGDYLRAAGGKLVARDIETEQTFCDIFATASQGDAVLGVKGIVVPLLARGGEHYVAHVLPLTSGARRRAGAAYAAVAALFVHKAALDTPSPPEVIATTFGLTPTELRVLFAIVEVGGVPQVAEALGIGETTVKTHLGRLYRKTGAGRQADLVKLVAGYSSPLVA